MPPSMCHGVTSQISQWQAGQYMCQVHMGPPSMHPPPPAHSHEVCSDPLVTVAFGGA